MDGALQQLDEALRGVEHLIDDIAADSQLAVVNPQIRRRIELQACATTVLMSGFFEEFLKGVTRSVATEVAACARPFSALPEELRDAHFEQGGHVLTTVHKAFKKGRLTHHWGTASPEEVTRRLYSPSASAAGSAAAAAAAAAAGPPGVVPAPPPYELLWEAFVDVRKNPDSEIVGNLFQRLGLKKPWPLLAVFLPRPAWNETLVVSVLNDLRDKRNLCAHTGEVAPPPDIPQMHQFVSMLRALSSAIVGLLQEVVRRLSGGFGPELPPI